MLARTLLVTLAALTASGLAAARVPPPTQPALSAAAKARIPEGGLWFAGQASLTDESGPLVVYHVTRGGVVEAYRNETDAIAGFGWVDAHTLVTVTAKGDHAVVQTFHDGVFARVFKVAPADWALGAGEALVGAPTLGVTRQGQIWLSQCATAATPCKRAALRVDIVPYIPAAKLPELAPERVSHAEGHELRVDLLPRLKQPPPGVTAKLNTLAYGDVKVQGVTCHSADGDSLWPPADDLATAMHPTRVSWISADPPIYAVEGTTADHATQALLFRACSADPLFDYLDLGDGWWAELQAADDSGAHGLWALAVGTLPVGRLLGSPTGFVMAPR